MQEPDFTPKPDQVDFTHIRYAPLINTVITHGGKLLLVRRSDGMRLFPGVWDGVSGFLDDNRSIEDKVIEELFEEVGIAESSIQEIKRGHVILKEDAGYEKTWLIMPILVRVDDVAPVLNWESQDARWLEPDELESINLLPDYHDVVAQFLDEL